MIIKKIYYIVLVVVKIVVEFYKWKIERKI